MKKIKWYKKINSESGEVMIESTIVLFITFTLLICMLSLGFYLCQQAMTYTIASETASYLADNYKYTTLSTIDKRVVELSDINQLKRYRTSISLTSIRNNSKSKANEYVVRRNRLTSFEPEKDAKISDIQFKSDSIGRTHVTVTIEVESNILFSGALEYCGVIKGTPKFTASANAECIDITGYGGQVGFVSYLGRKLSELNLGKSYEHLSNTVETLKELANKIIH